MIRISDAVEALVTGSPAMHFGLHHRLLNLSQVARFIHPLVEARTRKTVNVSAILMSLSRLQKKLKEPPGEGETAFYIDRIHLHAGLCSLTVAKTPASHRAINQLFNRVQEEGGYFTVTEGNTEITAILDNGHWALVGEVLATKPRQVHRDIAGLGIQFKAQYTEEPGLLYQLLQQLALQQISVVEIASTMTEFNIYLHDGDVMLAFESLYKKFVRPGASAG